MSRFGGHLIGEPGPLDRTGEELTGPERNGFKLEMLYRLNYDTMYGIFDHDNPVLEAQHPLALVSMHEKEKVEPHSSLYRMQARFIDYKVAQYTGMGFSEFILQPRDVVENWLALCQKAELSGKGASDRAARELEQAALAAGKGADKK